jgi:hypothetical protein
MYILLCPWDENSASSDNIISKKLQVGSQVRNERKLKKQLLAVDTQ